MEKQLPRDLLTTYREATGREARLRMEADKAAAERWSAILEMHRSGMSFAQIAEVTNLSRSRVQQLVEKGRICQTCLGRGSLHDNRLGYADTCPSCNGTGKA